jgi:hypothetical protein
MAPLSARHAAQLFEQTMNEDCFERMNSVTNMILHLKCPHTHRWAQANRGSAAHRAATVARRRR